MRHVSAIAATAHPRHRHHQLPDNAMMVAHSANNTDGIRIPAQIGNVARTEDKQTQMSWIRRPPPF
ncbi:MAG: hypothetical protein ABW200_19325 [Hyphomicrobiaceae bacterium]|jgi:hypothetical protein